jgi:tyrosyl-tRNA synthetase
MPAKHIIDELEWRGLCYQSTDEESLRKHLSEEPRSFYVGFDPTADSLTIGNLLPMTVAARLRQYGHRPVILFGGATGLIGDPSGKTEERALLTTDKVAHNLQRHEALLRNFFATTSGPEPMFVNNHEWLGPLSTLEFLRDVGKHFSVNEMLRRDTVRKRIESPDHGISFTEFSYLLLQSYDFLHLFRTYDVTLQIGASDQWGNIVGGIDLIRRKDGAEAHGLTFPLLTRADGTKFGKTEGGAIWLSADRTSPFTFYQSLVNLDDKTVETFVRFFSFQDREAVEELLLEHARQPARRLAQRAIAAELTERLHGEAARRRAELASSALFYGDPAEVDLETIEEGFADVPSLDVSRTRLAAGIPIVDVLVESGLARSRREAREFLDNGAISVNGNRADTSLVLRDDHLLHGSVLLLRRGRKHWSLVRVDQQ